MKQSSQTLIYVRADLYEADLQGALLKDATFNEQTRLPDGTFWTLQTDMSQFTNGHNDIENK